MSFTPGSSQPLPGPFNPEPIDYSGVAPPPDHPRPAGVGAPASGSTGEQNVQTMATHPNGAPTEMPSDSFWTFDEAQKAGTLNPNFQGRVDALIKASGGRVWLTSGFRDHAKQQRLYAQALKDHGAADAGNWVAVPGRSNHEKGEAADIHGDMSWLHANAAQFGLVFPMSWEPWHVEPAGLRTQSSPQAYTKGPVGSVNPTADPLIDSHPSEVMATVASKLFNSPLANPAQASPGASFSTAVTGGLTDKTGQVPGGTIPGVPQVSGADTRSGNVSSAGAPMPTTMTVPTTPGGKAQPVQVSAQAASGSQQDYINQILPYVQKESARTGVPVEVMIVQSGIETGWGTSGWWRNQRNPAGIGVTGQAGKGYVYGSLEEAFHDYADKLLGHGEGGQSEFAALVRAGAPIEQQLDALQRGPWAAGHYGGSGLTQTYAALKNAGVFTAAAAAATPPPAPVAAPPVRLPPAPQPPSRRSGRGSQRHV